MAKSLRHYAITPLRHYAITPLRHYAITPFIIASVLMVVSSRSHQRA
ncbi:hypothetical protein [Yersinia entomophaga]|nr:hypothetical protein [Yersinia entomophaga]